MNKFLSGLGVIVLSIVVVGAIASGAFVDIWQFFYQVGHWVGKLVVFGLIVLPFVWWDTKRENRRLYGK
jgi:hypothetical protein